MKPKGKHPHQALTATSVRNKTEPGRYADGNGLYLVVDPSGNKRWLLRLTIRKKRTDIGLGGWPTVSLADARAEAITMRATARKGDDPLAERRKATKEIPSFRIAAKTVHNGHHKSWRNQKHSAQWIKTLETYVYPFFGDLPVDRIGTAEVLAALSPIWLTRPETARRVRQRISTVMDWAKASGFRNDENPVRGITKALPKQPRSQKHHASLPYADLPDFLTELRTLHTNGSASLALEFLILTATRTGEVIGARWDEVDLESKHWTIPASRMKAKREFRVPLSSQAIQLLKIAAERSGTTGYVFQGRNSETPLSQMALLMTLRRMGRKVTTHGFRSTFRNWAAERTNHSREVCEAALAHSVKDKTEAAYLRTDQFGKRRKLMNSWAQFSTNSRIASVTNIKATA